jgi:WhiB family redox-sensing transcriptional regulator
MNVTAGNEPMSAHPLDRNVHINIVEIGVAASTDNDQWRDDAACTGNTRLFFPPKAERPQARARREAKAARLCGSCPVSTPCREFARDHREYGFWAGESEEERHLAGFTLSAPIGIRPRRHRAAS